MVIHNKLVRDRIPEIIAAESRVAEIRVLDHSSFIDELRIKLVEEVTEYGKSGDTTELVDVLEVLYALASNDGVSRDDLENMRLRKLDERGGFDLRLFLVESS